ncbi:hypothetical protein PVL30_001004 [Lodderomyces elongisporus]|uniref:uncharacterized protein n=1 Tax=Lodderomyces elongisporus TaxID=36914 RepID=UPI00291D76E6|nr:uncharacterized protein PVL30_001004 [Lodderomyces elongisporus]WLF77292.1 hypothetical protein PVL30_001004 [Lodderomyces elongisporus]
MIKTLPIKKLRVEMFGANFSRSQVLTSLHYSLMKPRTFHSSAITYKLFGKSKKPTTKPVEQVSETKLSKSKPEPISSASPSASSSSPSSSASSSTTLKSVSNDSFLKRDIPPAERPSGPTEQDFKTHPILKRIPKFLRNYASQFIHAPYSHLVAFLVLHELTAIIPLFGIWYYLHNHPGFIPMDLPQWALTKGASVMDKVLERMDWHIDSSQKISVIMEGAYAYTIVKFLLPVRAIVSLAGMPFFAKWFVVPIANLPKNLREMRKIKQEIKEEEKKKQVKKVSNPKL